MRLAAKLVSATRSGVGVAEAVFEYLDDAVTGHIQVCAGVAAVRQVVAREGVHERGVDPLGVEDVQQFAQVGDLFVLVAGVVAVQPDWPAVVAPFNDQVAMAALPLRAKTRLAPSRMLARCVWRERGLTASVRCITISFRVNE
jgi:hypothetical protein